MIGWRLNSPMVRVLVIIVPGCLDRSYDTAEPVK